MVDKREECKIAFTVGREAMDELFRTCSSSWEIWKNHATTVMPQIETSQSSLSGLSAMAAISSLFHLFCASPKRLVRLPEKKSGKAAESEYFCQPLSFVVFPDYKTGHGLRTPETVIWDRTGTSDELSLTFISVLKEIGCPGVPSLLRLENPRGASRYCALLVQGGRELFIDLVSGVLSSFDPGTFCKKEGGATLASSLLSLFGIGGGNSAANNALAGLYGAAGEPSDWKLSLAVSGEAALNFFWHFQNARKIASPLVSGDIILMASDDPAALKTIKSMSGADFSQAVSELSCAIDAYAQIPPEIARPISGMAEKAKKALEALEN